MSRIQAVIRLKSNSTLSTSFLFVFSVFNVSTNTPANETNRHIVSIMLIFSPSMKNPRRAVKSGLVCEITVTTVISIYLIEYYKQNMTATL